MHLFQWKILIQRIFGVIEYGKPQGTYHKDPERNLAVTV